MLRSKPEKVAPWRRSKPNDRCCHDAGIKDANGVHVADVADEQDVPLIVAAPQLQAEVERLRVLWRKFEWPLSGAGNRYCMVCGGTDIQGHRHDCELAALLQGK